MVACGGLLTGDQVNPTNPAGTVAYFANIAGWTAGTSNVVFTKAYNASGYGAAKYVRDIDQTTHSAALRAVEDYCRTQSADGIWFRISEPKLYATMFGAIPDATFDFGTGLWSGTDNAALIQVLINYCMYPQFGDFKVAYLDGGNFYISTSIQLGYGTTFQQVQFIGEGPNFDNQGAGAGLVHNFYDRMAINCQGLRISRIKSIGFCCGPYYNYLRQQQFCDPVLTPIVPDTNPDNWNLPGHVATDSRYAPCAAITVDAYSGTNPSTIPSTAYPNVTYPAFLGGGIPQFGKDFSSDVVFEDCSIIGYNTGFAVHPCYLGDGNGDFIHFKNSNIAYVKYCFSVGNGQARNTKIDYMAGGICYCVMTNNKHGQQIGRYSTTHNDISISSVIKLFEIGQMAFAGPLEFDALYVEAGYIIGTVEGASSQDLPLTLSNFVYDLTLQNEMRGIPAAIFYSMGSPGADITIPMIWKEGAIVTSYFVSGVNCSTIEIDNVYFNPLTTGSSMGAVSPPLAKMNNFTAGGLVLPSLRSSDKLRHIRYFNRNVDSGAAIGETFVQSDNTARQFCISYLLRQAGYLFREIGPRASPYLYDPSTIDKAVTAYVLGDRVITFINPHTASDISYLGGIIGDVMWDSTTGAFFVITAYNSGTGATTATLLSNYTRIAGVTAWINNPGVVGLIYIFPTRLYSITYPATFDMAGAALTITGITAANGATTALDFNPPVIGDIPMFDPTTQLPAFATPLPITNVNAGAHTITFGSSPSASAFVKNALRFLMRKD